MPHVVGAEEDTEKRYFQSDLERHGLCRRRCSSRECCSLRARSSDVELRALLCEALTGDNPEPSPCRLCLPSLN